MEYGEREAIEKDIDRRSFKSMLGDVGFSFGRGLSGDQALWYQIILGVEIV